MYINKIDDMIDNILDDFYSTVILKDNFFKKDIKNEKNFVKFQKEINEILFKYFKQIRKDDIRQIVNSEDNVKEIINILQAYISYYLFLSIGFYFKGSRDTFINNIIEFSKNQAGFKIKLTNYFNGSSNSKTIHLYTVIKNILTLLGADKSRLEILLQKVEFVDTAKLLNELGSEYVSANFTLVGVEGDTSLQAHNIIKTLIIKNIYIKDDKTNVYQIIESANMDTGEYIFIDIILPREVLLDFNAIENVLSYEDAADGIAYRIYDALVEYDKIKKEMSIESKILFLINNKLLVPIVDDFLLYHKDAERYDFLSDKKKKESTKIKYIINKIDTVSEYYSEASKKNKDIQKKIERYFNPVVKDRNAVIVNDLENLKIIDKLHKQGKIVIRNNEYYNDLVLYMKYPYINFKDFKDEGFRLTMNKTIDAVRLASFNNDKKRLQIRIGSDKMPIDILGFMIPKYKEPLECIIPENMDNIHDTTKNGYNGILKLLQDTIVRGKHNKKNTYWLINTKTDNVKLDKYKDIQNLTKTENAKIIVSQLYDEMIKTSYEHISNIINKRKNITIYTFKKIIENFSKKIFELPKDSIIYEELNAYVTYKKVFRTKEEYDDREDKFMGIQKDAIKLPVHKPHQEEDVISVSLDLSRKREKMEKEKEKEEISLKGAICQHNITWERITSIRRKNPNKFSELLIEFVYQYVMEDALGDYICKSCNIILPIKSYVQDGVFDDEGRYTSFSAQMVVPLEDIPEYEKYIPSIQNIDKMVDRISAICNFAFLYEKSSRNKNEVKKRVIKDTVDLLLIHNPIMKPNYKFRSENIIKTYGINREYTNLFIFNLDNSIFTYSSKDKDFYKFIKKNNILVYIILFILLELNDTHVIYMGGDKLCNYYIYTKIKDNIFKSLKIRINNEGKLDDIINYPVLCYMIFYISCMATKYDMWFASEEDKEKRGKRKFNPVTQKTIIHTLVDLINSILERTEEYNTNLTYKLLINRFYNKLISTYKNEYVINKLEKIHSKKVIIDEGKRKFKVMKISPIKLPEEYTIQFYSGVEIWSNRKCVARELIPLRDYIPLDYYDINNLTNCKTGENHMWKVVGKYMVCDICNERTDRLKYDASLSDMIMKNNSRIFLKKYAERYCKTGVLENFSKQVKKEDKLFEKCRKTDKLTDSELGKIFELYNYMIYVQKSSNQRVYQKFLAQEKEKSKNYHKQINNYKLKYKDTKNHKEDFSNYIKKFINKIKNSIGEDTNINGDNIYLEYDAYIIDHDHNGYKLDKPFILKDDDNKILFKKEHPFFKKDVIYYINNRFKVKIFYDAITKLLIGYQEHNKDFKYSKVKNQFVKVNYSVMNMVRMLGYRSRYLNMKNMKDDVEENYEFTDEQDLLKEVVKKVNRERLTILKKIISNSQRYINRIVYGFTSDDNITDKYVKKLKNMQISQGKNKVFKDWKVFINNLLSSNLDNKTINISVDDIFIKYEDFNYYDYHGNLALFYIINEYTKLIDLNMQKLIKNTVIYLILDIIIEQFNLFEKEIEYTNYEIRKFYYLLNSKYLMDVKADYDIEHTDGIYGEYVDPDAEITEDMIDQRIDDQEEFDSLDVDTEIDFQIDYA